MHDHIHVQVHKNVQSMVIVTVRAKTFQWKDITNRLVMSINKIKWKYVHVTHASLCSCMQ